MNGSLHPNTSYYCLMSRAFLVLSLCLIIGCSGLRTGTATGFSSAEQVLIQNGDSHASMRIYKITNTKDSLCLRQRSTDIKPDPNNAMLSKFIKRLYATVTDSSAMGVGIAAPQVGILKNIIWVQRFDKDNFPFEVYLNPKITNYSKTKQTVTEGCLSIPNKSATLNKRSDTISIVYNTPTGTQLKTNVSGFTAVIFQHEIDHLNGILYLDHLTKDQQEERAP